MRYCPLTVRWQYNRNYELYKHVIHLFDHQSTNSLLIFFHFLKVHLSRHPVCLFFLSTLIIISRKKKTNETAHNRGAKPRVRTLKKKKKKKQTKKKLRIVINILHFQGLSFRIVSFEPFYLEGSKVTRATVVLYKILSIEFHAGITRDASRLFESLRGLPRYAAWPDIVSRPRFPFVLRFGRTIWSQNWTCRSSVIYWVSHYQLVPNKDVLWKVRKIGHSLPFWELSPLINSFSNVVNLLSSFFLRSPSRRSSSFFF